MAKKVTWTDTAKISRENILEYWINRNKSYNYSIKLNKFFNNSAIQIGENPFSGIEIMNNIYRGKLIKKYYLIYKILENHIEIHLIWDTRQNPKKLLQFLKTIKG